MKIKFKINEIMLGDLIREWTLLIQHGWSFFFIEQMSD